MKGVKAKSLRFRPSPLSSGPQRNRPYSAVGVSDNSGGVVKKGPAEKALTALHEAGRIACKDLKKQKVYFATQVCPQIPSGWDEPELVRKCTYISPVSPIFRFPPNF